MSLSNYELAYLEIKRILIQYPIIKELNFVDEGEIDKLHKKVEERINKKPSYKEKIWFGANKALLNYIKKVLAGVNLPKPYEYADLVHFFRKDYEIDHSRLLSKAVLRLEKYLEKHLSKLEQPNRSAIRL